MKTSMKGRDLIRKFEGEKLKAYQCPAGVWTIGVGHTGPDVKPGMVITLARSDELLRSDLARFEEAVGKLAKVELSQGQFDALVSFAFNLGDGALGKSTLLRMLNAGDYAGAAHEFSKWNRAGGKVLPGLVARRSAEAAMFRGA
jgi:lysozyme